MPVDVEDAVLVLEEPVLVLVLLPVVAVEFLDDLVVVAVEFFPDLVVVSAAVVAAAAVASVAVSVVVLDFLVLVVLTEVDEESCWALALQVAERERGSVGSAL